MHDCAECFWAFHEGSHWEQAKAVAEQERKQLCVRLGRTHLKVPDNYLGDGFLGLGAPERKDSVSRLAEGGGKCWFSSIYFLLVGKKSG